MLTSMLAALAACWKQTLTAVTGSCWRLLRKPHSSWTSRLSPQCTPGCSGEAPRDVSGRRVRRMSRSLSGPSHSVLGHASAAQRLKSRLLWNLNQATGWMCPTCMQAPLSLLPPPQCCRALLRSLLLGQHRARVSLIHKRTYRSMLGRGGSTIQASKVVVDTAAADHILCAGRQQSCSCTDASGGGQSHQASSCSFC